MTVKQLRDWLIKQDETAEIRVATSGGFSRVFTMEAKSQMISVELDDKEPS